MRPFNLLSLPALFLLLILFTLNGCGPDTPQQVEPTLTPPQAEEEQAEPEPNRELPLATPEIPFNPAILRVGISLNTYPFIFKKDDRLQGVEFDLAEQLGAFIDRKVEFVRVPETRATEALLKNQVDILMSGRKITRQFSSPVAFSDPYLRSGQILLVRKHETALFSSGIYSLENSGYTFGVVADSDGDQFLTRSIRGIRIIRFKSAKAATQALLHKQIDLFLHDAPIVCAYAANIKGDRLSPIRTLVTEEFIGWEVRREDEELRRQANRFIQHLKADGRLQKTIRKWIPNL